MPHTWGPPEFAELYAEVFDFPAIEHNMYSPWIECPGDSRAAITVGFFPSQRKLTLCIENGEGAEPLYTYQVTYWEGKGADLESTEDWNERVFSTGYLDLFLTDETHQASGTGSDCFGIEENLTVTLTRKSPP
jgi:hypothetical protein